MESTKQKHGTAANEWIEKFIGIEKLGKAVLSLAAGIGISRIIHRDVEEWLTPVVRALHVDPDDARIHSLLARAFALTPAELRNLSIGSFLYAVLYLVEGVGLLRRKAWAEYLTITTTALFLPLEIYELYERVTALRSIVFVGNIAIVAFLIARVRSRRRRHLRAHESGGARSA